MADANGIIRPDSAEDCLVLLEELIRTTVILRQKTRSYGKSTRNQAKVRQKFCRGLGIGCMRENLFLAEDGAPIHDDGAQEIQLPFLRHAG